MLEKVRKPGRAKSIYQFIGYSLLGLICLSFAFIGLNTNVNSIDANGVAATVNSEVIPVREYRRALEAEQKQFGDGLNSLPAAQRRMFERQVREKTLNSLIATEVLYQSTEKYGFYTPKAAIRDQVVDVPYFQEDGRFSKETYLRLLTANGWTPGTYEGFVKRQVSLGEVRDSFIRAFKKPELVREIEAEAKNSKMNLEFVSFQQSDLAHNDKISAAELNKFKDSTEGKKEVQDYYDRNRIDFMVPKEVKARHILIKAGEGGRSFDEALKLITEIKKDLKIDNFSEVAKAKSEDQGSKEKGGDLGFFGKGKMVPEFENQAMTLVPGVISEPVKTDYGYHLILVDESRGGDTKPLEKVSDDIARTLLANRIRDEYLEKLEKTLAESKDVDSLIKELKFKWEETGEFDLSQNNVPKLNGVNQVVTEALKLKGNNKTVPKLIRADGKIFVVRLKSLKLANPSIGKSVAGNSTNDFSNSAMEALNRWTEGLQQDSKIKKNMSLLEI